MGRGVREGEHGERAQGEGEHDERPQEEAVVDPVVRRLLTAVDEPAFVCTSTGSITVGNAELATAVDAPSGGVAGRSFEDVVNCDDDPLSRAVRTGDEERASGRLVDGPACAVVCRPVERDGAVADVVVECPVGVDEPAVVDWEDVQLSGLLSDLPVVLVGIDAAGTVEYCRGLEFDALECDRAEVVGAPVDRFESVSEDLVEWTDAALDGETVGGRAAIADRSFQVRFTPLETGESVIGAVAVAVEVTERERRAAELETVKQRLELALDSTDAGVHEWEIGEDRVHWHETTSRLFGLDPETTVRPPEAFRERVHPEDRGRVHEAVQSAVESGGEVNVEYRIRRPDGETQWMLTEGEVHRRADGPDRFVGTVRDVTDRRERERELARTNHRLDLALDNTEAGVYEWLVDEDRVVWHESVRRLFDIDPDRTYALADAIDDLIHPADRERVRDAIGTAVERGGGLDVEFRTAGPVENGDRETDGDDETVGEAGREEGDARWVSAEGEIQYDDEGRPERIVGTIRDITDRRERERQLVEREQRLRAVIESSPDPISMQDPDGNYQVVNEAMVDRTGNDRGDLLGARPGDVFGPTVAARLERHRETVLDTERAMVVEEKFPSTEGGSTVQLTIAPYYGTGGEVQGTVSTARDVTELERQRDELETLTELQELVQESVSALAAATTREEIQRTVCDRLAGSPFYDLAWIGERAPSSTEVAPSCVAGDEAGYLEEVTVTVDPAESGRGPGGRAYRNGTVEVVHDVTEDESFEPWREAALDRGFRSLAAVPLTHGSTTHGILAVYADEPNAFSKRELGGLRTLGEVVGFALSAAQYRRLLKAETVLELEFEVRSDESPFITASGEHDCRFVMDHAAHTTEEHVINYLTVEGADPELGKRVANRLPTVERIRELDRENGPHFELTITDSVFQYLARAGARGNRGVIEDGVGHLYVEAPGDIDVRTVTEAVERRFGPVDLSAKREKHRTDSPWWHPSGDAGAQLTDRQRSVLRTAFYSGYYEWPRETDSEELADSLDVASSTVLQHLRKGHRHVLESMFES